MSERKTEPIDRSHVKEPREVSGWGSHEDGRPQNDFSDIARHEPKNAEFDPRIGHATTKGRAERDDD